MIIEGLGTVSFVNGLLKVQTIGVNSAGEAYETGQLEIPGGRVGDIINGLTNAAKGIQEKLKESDESTVVPDTNEKKTNKKNKKSK